MASNIKERDSGPTLLPTLSETDDRTTNTHDSGTEVHMTLPPTIGEAAQDRSADQEGEDMGRVERVRISILMLILLFIHESDVVMTPSQMVKTVGALVVHIYHL